MFNNNKLQDFSKGCRICRQKIFPGSVTPPRPPSRQPCAWLASYFTERRQYCYFNGQNSEMRLVTYGIPQGSFLGPLLFMLYSNEFEGSLTKFEPNLYADDPSITLDGGDAYQLLEDLRNQLQDVIDWPRKNKLSLNITKCEYMFFGNK